MPLNISALALIGFVVKVVSEDIFIEIAVIKDELEVLVQYAKAEQDINDCHCIG